MYDKVYNNPEIYKVYVPLPNNPLKNLNCYVVKTSSKNLIIDTGFNMPECREALKEGLKDLEIDINKSEMFLTHLHSDHIGLAGSIMNEDSKIYMGEVDYNHFIGFEQTNSWKKTEERMCLEGFPSDQIDILRSTNPARAFAPTTIFNAIKMNDGDKITVGDYEFTCILTPGHTPGHMCLYLESEKLMFLGDHVLFDITPNITCWNGVNDSLGNYIESLKKIRSYEIKTALPGHRKNDMDVYVRIDEILKHHEERLNNTLNIISKNEGLTAWEIASKMVWSMRGKDWGEFPMSQKWFAVGETIAHLDYLLLRGEISKNLNANNLNTYYYV